jgi:hypothetical protein
LTKIEIKKVGKDSYVIKLDGAMTTFVSRDELLTMCEEIQRETGDYDYE